MTEVVSIFSEKITEIVEFSETKVFESAGEVDKTVGPFESTVKEVIDTGAIVRNFGSYPEYDDAKNLQPKSLPYFDVLCAGFPCQAFSIAGKRLGFEDTRGTIFFEIARIAKEKRPPYLFLENVRGLLSHDKGRTFDTIISTLDEMGYDAEWQVLNSKYFVPQNRERIFIVGHLRDRHTRPVSYTHLTLPTKRIV